MKHVRSPMTAELLPDNPAASRAARRDVSIWLVDSSACQEYERFVEAHPAGSVYHSLRWRAALVASGVGDPVYLLALAGDEPVGVLPLLRTGAATQRLVSLPRTPAAGILAYDPAVAWLLASRAVQVAERRGCAEVWLRTFRRRAAPGEHDWVRAPLAALPTRSGVASRKCTPDDLDWLAARPGARGVTGLLRELSGSPGADLQVCEIEGAGPALVSNGPATPQCGAARAVWLRHGASLHVLAWAAAGDLAAAAPHLLSRVASAANGSGARWVDFPFWAGLRAQPVAASVAYACELPVDLHTADTSVE